MDEFVKKLIERLEESKAKFVFGIKGTSLLECMEVNAVSIIAHQLAEEYNNDFCEWNYDGAMYERCPHTETLFARIHNCDEKIFKYCPYCGKKIKVVE